LRSMRAAVHARRQPFSVVGCLLSVWGGAVHRRRANCVAPQNQPTDNRERTTGNRVFSQLDAEVLLVAAVVVLVGEIVAEGDPGLVADPRTAAIEPERIFADRPAQTIVARGDRLENGFGNFLRLRRI